MAQHDYVIDNQSFPSTRTDINNVLLAISSTNSGTSAPSTTYANQLWYDTTNNKLYIRNEDNDAWIPLFLLDQSNDVAGTLATEIDVEDASGTDTAGTSLTVKGGAGTGTGAGGSIVFQTADGAGSTGSSVNAHATRVTITDDGKVGIGATPASAPLEVSGDIRALRSDANTQYGVFGQDSSGGFITTHRPHASLFENFRFLASNNGGTEERMRIDSTGKVGIGATPDALLHVQDTAASTTTHSYTKLHIEDADHLALQFSGGTGGEQWIWFADDTSSSPVGGITYYHGAPYMAFRVEGSNRMLIDSVGQVIIGKTSASVTTAGVHVAGNETADGSPAYIYSVKSFNGTRNVLLNYHAASGTGTYVGGINMTNTSTSFPTSSDERLKKNIVDAPSAGDKIDAMQVRSFNWKADDSFQEYGLIAQELQSVYDLPVEHHDNEDTYTVDYSKLVPVLLKEIQDLRKRVATLEAN